MFMIRRKHRYGVLYTNAFAEVVSLDESFQDELQSFALRSWVLNKNARKIYLKVFEHEINAVQFCLDKLFEFFGID